MFPILLHVYQGVQVTETCSPCVFRWAVEAARAPALERLPETRAARVAQWRARSAHAAPSDGYRITASFTLIQHAAARGMSIQAARLLKHHYPVTQSGGRVVLIYFARFTANVCYSCEFSVRSARGRCALDPPTRPRSASASPLREEHGPGSSIPSPYPPSPATQRPQEGGRVCRTVVVSKPCLGGRHAGTNIVSCTVFMRPGGL